MADLSEKVTSGPLDTPALNSEVTDLWHNHVQPALVALNADLRLTKLGQDLALNAAGDFKSLAGAALMLGLGSVTELSQLAANGLAAAAALGPAAAKAVKEDQERRRSAQTHDLYYLLAVNRRL